MSNTRNFVGGSCVDLVMRTWLDDPLHPPGAMAAMVDTVLDNTVADEKESGNVVRWRNAADRDEVLRFCTELVTRLEPILREHVLPYPYECGKWFKVPVKIPGLDNDVREILLTGEMDLIVDNDGPIVLDLKGTADESYWRKVLGQLQFYDLAVFMSSGTKTRFTGLIQPMCKERVLTFQISDEDRRAMTSRVVAYAHDVWRNETSCKEGTAGCNWCDVRHACSRYQKSSIDVFGSLADGLRQAAGDAA